MTVLTSRRAGQSTRKTARRAHVCRCTCSYTLYRSESQLDKHFSHLHVHLGELKSRFLSP